MPERTRPLEIKNGELQVDLTSYGLLALELAKRLESRTDCYPNNLLYLPGSSYLAAIIAKTVGIYPTKKIDLRESPESIFIPEEDNVIIIANQNVSQLTFFGKTLNILYKPNSLTIGVLFEREAEENKADIAIYKTGYKVKFPHLPELTRIR